jgi:hypothetical protein
VTPRRDPACAGQPAFRQGQQIEDISGQVRGGAAVDLLATQDPGIGQLVEGG